MDKLLQVQEIIYSLSDLAHENSSSVLRGYFISCRYVAGVFQM